MTAVDQAVSVMQQARLEIITLRAEKADLLDALIEARAYLTGDAERHGVRAYVNRVIARMEATDAQG